MKWIVLIFGWTLLLGMPETMAQNPPILAVSCENLGVSLPVGWGYYWNVRVENCAQGHVSHGDTLRLHNYGFMNDPFEPGKGLTEKGIWTLVFVLSTKEAPLSSPVYYRENEGDRNWALAYVSTPSGRVWKNDKIQP